MAAALLSVGVGAAAVGAPIHYEEDETHDLAMAGGPLFTFDIGVNTVAGFEELDLGTIIIGGGPTGGVISPADTGPSQDLDSFRFAIPDGMEVTSATLEGFRADRSLRGIWAIVKDSVTIGAVSATENTSVTLPGLPYEAGT